MTTAAFIPTALAAKSAQTYWYWSRWMSHSILKPNLYNLQGMTLKYKSFVHLFIEEKTILH